MDFFCTFCGNFHSISTESPQKVHRKYEPNIDNIVYNHELIELKKGSLRTLLQKLKAIGGYSNDFS
jgi:hypothetical protein